MSPRGGSDVLTMCSAALTTRWGSFLCSVVQLKGHAAQWWVSGALCCWPMEIKKQVTGGGNLAPTSTGDEASVGPASPNGSCFLRYRWGQPLTVYTEGTVLLSPLAFPWSFYGICIQVTVTTPFYFPSSCKLSCWPSSVLLLWYHQHI